MKKALLVLVSVLLAVVPLGGASAKTLTDPNDSSGLLDIETISLHYDSSTGVLTLQTWHGWGCKALRRGVKTSLKWYFDGKSDGDTDLVGKFICVSPNKSPHLVLKLHGTETGNNYELVPARKLDRRTVKTRFPFDLTEIKGNRITVWAKSKDWITGGCDDGCPDKTGKLSVHK